MSSMKRSLLLEYILESAEKRAKEEGKGLSVEFLLVRTFEICVLDNIKSVEKLGVEGINEIDKIKLLFHDNNIDRSVCEKILKKLSVNGNSFMDGIVLRKILMNAGARAEKENDQSITATIVLQEIFSNPTQIIKEILAGKTGEANEKTEISEKKTNNLFSMQDSREDVADNPHTQSDVTGTEAISSESFLKDLTERVKQMQNVLLKQVYGQDHAVSTFVSGYFQSQIMGKSDRRRSKPGAAFLFAGAPGVGKTFLAEKAAEALQLPFCRFDMSEYSNPGMLMEFCGSDKVYKGAKAGAVTSFVKDNPKCILLFDEIEKAHLDIIHLFLQILDAGRLRDNYFDEEVSFQDAVIILTTNAGRQLYEESRERNLSGISRKTIIRALRNDISERTGTPLFPAAICSRFASGNVVMFNHMEARDLCRIVKAKLAKNAEAIKAEFGLDIEIDEDVHTALLFSEGGNADARTVTGRAENFLNVELFELFRLIASESNSYDLGKLKKIRLTVELPEDDAEVMELFRAKQQQHVLVFAPATTLCCEIFESEQCVIHAVSEYRAAMRILKEEEIAAVFIEPAVEGGIAAKKYLNIEDIVTPYMEFYRYVCTLSPVLPVYIIQTEETVLSEEEKVSFTRTGARGISIIQKGQMKEQILEVCDIIHQQKGMDTLSKYNKVVNFESAQKIGEDGQTAEIRFIQFKLSYAVDADDRKKVLAGVSRPDLTFDQVIGAEDAKEELKFFADYLKNPRKYIKKGLRPPKGILLYGPPGTGKTMLAKAMAAEADMTFLTAEGGQFLKKYVGEGPETVHDLFRTARKYAPAILFIDEIDAIGKQRTGDDSRNVGGEILNALLTEMDGFRNEEAASVFVLAATNFDVSGTGPASLDAALVRRFDRKIMVELPTREERRQFLTMKCSAGSVFSVSEEKIGNLVVRSTGMSLASLDSVLELALRSAVRCQAEAVTDDILEDAFETFNSGREKKWNPEYLKRTARHEAGHALLCWKSGEVPAYLTIVARAGHGGYMQQESAEDKGIYTKKELLGRICTALAGRAAELVYYGSGEGITTGASGDLEIATNLARYMICSCGMDEETGLAVVSKEELNTGDIGGIIRKKINEILQVQLNRAMAIICENRNTIDEVVDVLMRENHIDGGRMKRIFENGQ